MDRILEGKCCVCGADAEHAFLKRFHGEVYCRRHYLQMYRHGKIYDRTIYDRNQYIDYPDGHSECIAYNKHGEESGRVIFDTDKKSLFDGYKIYIRRSNGHPYAAVTRYDKKIFLHRIIMGMDNEKYSINRAVDHINGNTLDNRMCNLRICDMRHNSKNMHSKARVTGVRWAKANHKWTAAIMDNYHQIYLGYYEVFEEAVLARIRKEKEICGEFGVNKDLYYVLSLPSPVEELKRVLSDGA